MTLDARSTLTEIVSRLVHHLWNVIARTRQIGLRVVRTLYP
jgi:hypothetical protein